MEPKFKIGDRVIWEIGPATPHGNIADGPIQNAISLSGDFIEKYAYVVSFDGGGARLLNESVLAFEEELGKPQESELSRDLRAAIKATDELVGVMKAELATFLEALKLLRGLADKYEKKDDD